MSKKISDFRKDIDGLLVYDCEDLNNTHQRKGLKTWKECVPWLKENFRWIIDSALEYSQSAPEVLPYPFEYNKENKNGKRDGLYIKPKVVNRGKPEDHIAMGLYNLSKSGKSIVLKRVDGAATDIGEVVDYQVPIFHTSHTGGGRKIDLLSIKREVCNGIIQEKLYILELKRDRSVETLPRCLMEAYTYSVMVKRDKLIHDYGLSPDAKIVVCPLIFDQGEPFDEYMDYVTGESVWVSELVKCITDHDSQIGVEFAILDRKGLENAIPADKAGNPFDKRWFAGSSEECILK